jgi:hypothetical protein
VPRKLKNARQFGKKLSQRPVAPADVLQVSKPELAPRGIGHKANMTGQMVVLEQRPVQWQCPEQKMQSKRKSNPLMFAVKRL